MSGEPRNQFTFYRSYFEAIEPLPKKDRSAIILAVCEYGLYETEPKGLSPVAMACFNLIRPTLDSGRRKAASGKQGGKSSKQSASKPQAPGKQSAREKEREKEEEKEIEKENECKGIASEANSFAAFFSAYPRQSYEDEARDAWAALDPDDLPAVLASLDRWKASDAWTVEGGKYIPCAAKWLGKGLWRDVPPACALKQRELSPDEVAAIERMVAEGEPDILWSGGAKT